MTEKTSDDINQNDWSPTHRRHHGSYWLAIIFIVVGLLLLLQNFDLVQPAVWSEIAKFWPVLIIMIGLEIIFGRSAAGRLLLVLITLLIVLSVLVAVGLIPLMLIPAQFRLY